MPLLDLFHNQGGGSPIVRGFEVGYYVDASSGNDANEGKSPSTAWKTIAKVNAATLVPGDNILFKRGEIWREQLTIPSFGTFQQQLVFGVYGSGNLPVITAADLVITWSDEGSDVWSATLTTEPSNVFFDTTWGTEESAQVDVDAEFDWFWNANVLYIYSTSDPDTAYPSPGIEAVIRDYCIYNNDSADYITLQNLEVKYGSVSPIYSDQNNGWRIDGCTAFGGEQTNIFGRGNPTGAGSATEWQVTNNTVGEMYCSTDANETRAGIVLRGMSSPLVNNNTVETVRSIAIVISPGTWDGTGATSTSPTVSNNSVTNSEAGILLKKTTSAIVRYNHVYDSRGFGIAFNTNSDNAIAYYNLIHDLANSTDTVMFNGFDINIGSVDGELYNNTVYGVHNSCAILEGATPSDGWTIRNNIFDSSTNDTQGGVTSSIRVAVEVTDYTYSNNMYNFDLMVAETEFDWRQSYEAWITFLVGIANGSDVNSDDVDPLFTNPGGDDFTLQAGSPCRNVGIDVGLVRDFVGNPVPQETNPSMGCYEYTG